MSKNKQPLWLGGTAASMAACCTHPLDQTKYRMQVQTLKRPMLRTLYFFASRDGIPSLWTGLTASILRQSTYSTSRFGIYNYLAHSIRQKSPSHKLSTTQTVACAGIAGGLAGLIGNPTEIVLVRMCADGAKAPSQRFRYRNALEGLMRVGREEGMRAFFKGLTPNIIRSVLMNVSQLTVYTTTKSFLLSPSSSTTMPISFLNPRPTQPMTDGLSVHILASLAAGTVATTVCAPADVLKSRLQSAASGENGKTILQTITHALRIEGLGFLMKGWTPAWLRLAPNTILMFIFMEQLERLITPAPVPAQTIDGRVEA